MIVVHETSDIETIGGAPGVMRPTQLPPLLSCPQVYRRLGSGKF